MATDTLKKVDYYKNEILEINTLISSYEDSVLSMQILKDDSSYFRECTSSLRDLSSSLKKIELKKMLSLEADQNSAIISINPGAGGVDSEDWALILFRMYTRFCEKMDYQVKIVDYQRGDENGLKSGCLEAVGVNAYGMLKSEIGVHRLVRISPFNSNGKRHTSFSSVFVYPIVENNIHIEINDNDLKIDTYRASGAGGQHVNKTDSAVRITHIPSGMIVQCQNQRSQLNNKKSALKMLKAKLYSDEIEKRNTEKNILENSKMKIGWGSQIRSYVMHPYSLVKDHRTKEETSNIEDVLNGNINKFIDSYLYNLIKEV